MTELEVELYNSGVRIRDFWGKNSTDFPLDSVNDKNFKIITIIIPRIEASGELQSSNIAKSATVFKDNALSALLSEVRNINRTAKAIAVDKPEIGTLFLMPPTISNQRLLATAADFYTNSEQHEEIFISYDLPADFRAKLQACISDLQTAITNQNNAKNAKTGATGKLKADLTIIRNARKRLVISVANLYRENPAKLAAWNSASHINKSDGTSNTAKLKKDTEQNTDNSDS